MFLKFKTKEDRKSLYTDSTAFIELQYCKMPKNSKIRKMLSLKHAKYCEIDSLYIHFDDFDLFLDNYAEILNNTTYNNLGKGPFDMYGYNYYEPSQVIKIIDRIKKIKPVNFNEMLKWLEESQNYNGFYIIGI